MEEEADDMESDLSERSDRSADDYDYHVEEDGAIGFGEPETPGCDQDEDWCGSLGLEKVSLFVVDRSGQDSSERSFDSSCFYY